MLHYQNGGGRAAVRFEKQHHQRYRVIRAYYDTRRVMSEPPPRWRSKPRPLLITDGLRKDHGGEG